MHDPATNGTERLITQFYSFPAQCKLFSAHKTKEPLFAGMDLSISISDLSLAVRTPDFPGGAIR